MCADLNTNFKLQAPGLDAAQRKNITVISIVYFDQCGNASDQCFKSNKRTHLRGLGDNSQSYLRAVVWPIFFCI